MITASTPDPYEQIETLAARYSQQRAHVEARKAAPPGETDREALGQAERESEETAIQLIKAWTPLLDWHTERYASSSLPESQVQAAAQVGMLRALMSFTPGEHTFVSWTHKPVQREVLRAIRDNDNGFHHT